MKYAIVVNPVSGKMGIDQKKRALTEAVEILGADCIIAGLDTTSRKEFCSCVRDLSRKVDTIIIAGGDGTVSDAVNSLDPDVRMGYLPLGSACALGQALKLPRNIRKAAIRIRAGRLHNLDLILCENNKKAVMASIGINAHTIQVRKKLLKMGIKGGLAYTVGTISSFFKYQRTDITIDADGEIITLRNVISTIIAKTPSFGYRMILIPEAKIDDGYLHLLAVNAGGVSVAYNILKSFVAPISVGEYRKAKNIRITTKDERHLQIDGDIYKKAKEFQFKVLQGAFKLIY